MDRAFDPPKSNGSRQVVFQFAFLFSFIKAHSSQIEDSNSNSSESSEESSHDEKDDDDEEDRLLLMVRCHYDRSFLMCILSCTICCLISGIRPFRIVHIRVHGPVPVPEP